MQPMQYTQPMQYMQPMQYAPPMQYMRPLPYTQPMQYAPPMQYTAEQQEALRQQEEERAFNAQLALLEEEYLEATRGKVPIEANAPVVFEPPEETDQTEAEKTFEYLLFLRTIAREQGDGQFDVSYQLRAPQEIQDLIEGEENTSWDERMNLVTLYCSVGRYLLFEFLQLAGSVVLNDRAGLTGAQAWVEFDDPKAIAEELASPKWKDLLVYCRPRLLWLHSLYLKSRDFMALVGDTELSDSMIARIRNVTLAYFEAILQPDTEPESAQASIWYVSKELSVQLDTTEIIFSQANRPQQKAATSTGWISRILGAIFGKADALELHELPPPKP